MLDAFIQAFTGSHVYIAEYLVDEVLKRQTEEMQTSCCNPPSSTPERRLCEAVTAARTGR